MHIGFTGTSKGMTKKQKDWITGFLISMRSIKNVPLLLHHGDCIGADEQFHDIGIRKGNQVILHPPKNDKARAFCEPCLIIHPVKEYLDRNKDIVNDCDILLATPFEFKEILRSGTWSTIRYAKKIKKHYVIIYPDGKAG